MKQWIFSSEINWIGPLLRLVLALVLWPHGAQKLLGWFGGYGFNGTMGFFTQTVHLPWIIAFSVIMLEFFGPIALILGIGTRVVAILMVILFIGIVWTSHLKNGFFMNWFGNQPGEGYEFFIAMIGLCLALVFNGAGKWSLDQLVLK